jgi:hypothetical protein
MAAIPSTEHPERETIHSEQFHVNLFLQTPIEGKNFVKSGIDSV